MADIFRIFHLTNELKQGQDKHIAMIRDAAALAREALKINAAPDTFVGRKTQELFPKENG